MRIFKNFSIIFLRIFCRWLVPKKCGSSKIFPWYSDTIIRDFNESLTKILASIIVANKYCVLNTFSHTLTTVKASLCGLIKPPKSFSSRKSLVICTSSSHDLMLFTASTVYHPELCAVFAYRHTKIYLCTKVQIMNISQRKT